MQRYWSMETGGPTWADVRGALSLTDPHLALIGAGIGIVFLTQLRRNYSPVENLALIACVFHLGLLPIILLRRWRSIRTGSKGLYLGINETLILLMTLAVWAGHAAIH